MLFDRFRLRQLSSKLVHSASSALLCSAVRCACVDSMSMSRSYSSSRRPADCHDCPSLSLAQSQAAGARDWQRTAAAFEGEWLAAAGALDRLLFGICSRFQLQLELAPTPQHVPQQQQQRPATTPLQHLLLTASLLADLHSVGLLAARPPAAADREPLAVHCSQLLPTQAHQQTAQPILCPSRTSTASSAHPSPPAPMPTPTSKRMRDRAMTSTSDRSPAATRLARASNSCSRRSVQKARESFCTNSVSLVCYRKTHCAFGQQSASSSKPEGGGAEGAATQHCCFCWKNRESSAVFTSHAVRLAFDDSHFL